MSTPIMRVLLPPIFVVYDHPRDFPEHVVVRIWYGEVASPIGCLFQTVDEARKMFEEFGLVRLERHPDDDPCIMETWL